VQVSITKPLNSLSTSGQLAGTFSSCLNGASSSHRTATSVSRMTDRQSQPSGRNHDFRKSRLARLESGENFKPMAPQPYVGPRQRHARSRVASSSRAAARGDHTDAMASVGRAYSRQATEGGWEGVLVN
jgi:hypothetical protein